MAEFPSLPSLQSLHARLIPGWRSAWRLWSVRVATLGAGLTAAWQSIPAELRDRLPRADRIAAGIFVAVAVARLLAQGASTPIASGQEDRP